MNITLKKSFTSHNNLHKSVISQFPQNSKAQSSDFSAEQKGEEIFKKIGVNRHQRFQSMIVTSKNGWEQDSLIHEIPLHNSYFDVIEQTLLQENKNLKNHNCFLAEQIKKLFQREKVLKGVISNQKIRIIFLEDCIRELDNIFKDIVKDIANLASQIDFIKSAQRSTHDTNNHHLRLKSMPSGSTETESTSVFQSIQTLKANLNRFDQEQDILNIFNTKPRIPENPEYDSRKIEMKMFSTSLDRQYNREKIHKKMKINERQDKNRILLMKELKQRISNLCKSITGQATISKHTINFKKQKTMGCE